MIRINGTTIYIVILSMIGFSLGAIEPTEKLSIDEAMVREYYRMQQAIAQQLPFSFDQDLINIVGFDQLMERFFPAEVWDTGVLLPRNVEYPQIPFSRRQIGPDVDFESLHPVPNHIASPQEDSINDFGLNDNSLDDLEGVLSNAFVPLSPQLSIAVESPERMDNAQARSSRRSLLAQLTASPASQEEGSTSGSIEPDFDGLLAGAFTSYDQGTNAVAADRLLRMIAQEPGSSDALSTSRVSAQRRLFDSLNTPPRSGQKRQGEGLETPSRKRSRTEKEEIDQEEEFVTPGDLTPIYDLLKKPRTPEDEGGDGGGSFQGGLQPMSSALSIARRLQF